MGSFERFITFLGDEKLLRELKRAAFTYGFLWDMRDGEKKTESLWPLLKGRKMVLTVEFREDCGAVKIDQEFDPPFSDEECNHPDVDILGILTNFFLLKAAFEKFLEPYEEVLNKLPSDFSFMIEMLLLAEDEAEKKKNDKKKGSNED